MGCGYMGKICVVDLTEGKIRDEELDDGIYRRFIGGEGLGARIIYEGQAARVDALGPENMLGFLTGLLTGCGIPAASRTTVVTKSPLTGTWGDSNVGGSFGPELKACGYDAIFLKGIAPKPVYLLMTQEKVELKDAVHLWGKDTVETSDLLRREIGDPKIKVASIGPAGENLSLISSIIIDGRAAARSGVGAVMGSKRLKSVVVRGKKKTQVSDPEAIKAMAKDYTKSLMESDYFVIKTLREYGTCGLVSLGIRLGITPIKNWAMNGEEAFPTHANLDGDNVIKYQTARSGCAGCPISCGGTVKIDAGGYKGIETRKPEYETLASFGSMTLNDNVESIIKAEDVCDRYGIDTISVGSAIAFAMDCYEKGILTKKETGGIDLTWGNVSGMLSLLDKIVKREGLGALLADGVKRAAEQIGRGSDQFAIHIHGQEIAYHDFRYELPGRGTVYIADPTPSRHERFTGPQLLEMGQPLGPYPEFQPRLLDNPDYKAKGEIYATGSQYYEVFVSCGLCAFTMAAVSTLPLVNIISAATGWRDFSPSELLTAGERIQTLRQAFNIREGVRPRDFFLPRRLEEPPVFQGPMKGDDINYDYKGLRAAYYESMNWHPETGEPSRERWQQLGLDILEK